MPAIANETRLEQLRADADRCGPDARKLFDRLLSEGKTPEAAAMYACQQAPGTKNTDRAFSQGQQRKMENMSPLVRTMLQKRAKAAGLDTRGKYYVGGPFGAHDSRSWVTCAEDLVTIAKKNNLNLEGVLNRRADNTDPKLKESKPIAPDIVRQLMRKRMKADPGLAAKCKTSKHAREALRDEVVAAHSRKKTFKKSNRLLQK
jgi:hypothetical protein